jgi:hypothetical protein
MGIDLIRTHHEYAEKHGKAKIPKISPFPKTVHKYSSILTKTYDNYLIDGIRLPLIYEIRNFSWWEEIFGFPLFPVSLSMLDHYPFDRANRIADSLIFSIIHYRNDLKDVVSGLASCTRFDLACACFLFAIGLTEALL